MAGAMVTAGANRRGTAGRGQGGPGWTFVELLTVMVLVAVVVVIGGLSVYRGQRTSEQLACQANMRAIHSALQIYWEKNRDPVTNEHTYPKTQDAFDQFLASPAYFVDGELHCPQDTDRSRHYTYQYTPHTPPVPGDVVITCPVPDSGHGSM
jgi:type II secretory pathway pseudopilin PulG